MNTAEKLLDTTQDLIQSQGYNAISLSQIASEVGIRKPTILHHYPSKADLGKAVVKRYRQDFGQALERMLQFPDKTAIEALNFYFTPYINIGEMNHKICLCGALSGEYTALPEKMQDEVSQFFNEHLEWLETILKNGKKRKEFYFTQEPSVLAKLILDSLQGALIIQRATNDSQNIIKTIQILIQIITTHPTSQ